MDIEAVSRSDGIHKSHRHGSNEALTIEELKAELKKQQEELIQHQQALLFHEPTVSNQLSGNANFWSFSRGLVVGQVSVLVIIAIFIKFFVFEEPSAASSSTASRDYSSVIVKREKQIGKDHNSNSGNETLQAPIDSQAANVKSILEKTYYDVDNHASESLDWFNVLIAQMISQLRNEALLADNIYHSLNDFLSQSDLPDYLGKIQLTEIDIGDDFPIFSNCRIKHSQDNPVRLEAKIDVDLSDTLTLGIETKLLMNHPRPLTAVLPVELSVSIVRFSGCLTVSLVNTNDQDFAELDKSSTESSMSPSVSADNQSSPRSNASGTKNDDNSNTNDVGGTALMFSFSPDYRLEFSVNSLIGSRSKLKDVPKISSLIESKLRSWFIGRCVEPRFQVIKLPSIWPRRKNTREPVNVKAAK